MRRESCWRDFFSFFQGRRPGVLMLLLTLLCLNTMTFAQGAVRNALVFKKGDTIERYVARSVKYLDKNHHVGTERERKYAYPFYVKPKASCDKVTGFLLLHGLAVNPSNMRDISKSIQQRDKCAFIFAPIMAGHATTLDDAVNVHYQDWVTSTKNAYLYLKNTLAPDKTIIVGYSTGGTLALNLLTDLDPRNYPDGVVLFAPGTRYKERLKVWLARFLYFFSIDFFPRRLQETNPFETRTNVVNELVQFSDLAGLTRAKWERASKEVRQIPMLVIAAEDDDVIDTQTTVKLLAHNSNHTHIYLIPPQVPSGDGKINSVIEQPSTGLTTVLTTSWPHHGHTGITIAPGNEFINSRNYYCKYTPVAEIIKNKMVSLEFSHSHTTSEIEKMCSENLRSWHTGNALDPDMKTYRPAENKYFDRMMNNIVHPFIEQIKKGS